MKNDFKFGHVCLPIYLFCLSAGIIAAATGLIIVKFGIGDFLRKSV
jgi:hypothetical protein